MTDTVSVESNLDIRAAYLSAEELKLAASLLFQTYHDDPVFLEIFNSEKEGYEQRVRASLREELNTFWQAKQPIIGLFLGDSLVGVACLNSPDDTIGSERIWHWHLKMILSTGYLSTKQMREKDQKIIAAVPLKKFHMLSFIAIHPLHQNHGLGHHLMGAVDTILREHTDSEGVAVYATSAKFKAFFEGANYKFIQDVNVGKVSGALMVHYRDK
jgi:GNAT superfamily N-acetyltransferase